MANRYMKRCSTLQIIMKMHIKITIKYHLTPDRMAIINKQEITSVGKDVEKREHFCTTGGNINSATTIETIWRFLKILKVDLPYDLAILLLDIYSKDMKTGY